MIAPFWGDLDMRLRKPPTGTVYYQIYEKHSNAHSVDTSTEYVMRRAKHDVRTFAGDLGFDPSVVIVITWETMNPFYQPYNLDEVIHDKNL